MKDAAPVFCWLSAIIRSEDDLGVEANNDTKFTGLRTAVPMSPEFEESLWYLLKSAIIMLRKQ